jgi:hypothetical protein
MIVEATNISQSLIIGEKTYQSDVKYYIQCLIQKYYYNQVHAAYNISTNYQFPYIYYRTAHITSFES